MITSHQMIFSMKEESGKYFPIPTTLRYDTSKPLAIQAKFSIGRASINWLFSREGMAEGLTRKSGKGDIVIEPGGSYRLGAVEIPLVKITLNTPDGKAVLEASLAEIRRFLIETYNQVPSDQEEEHLNIDAEIAKILEDAGA